jgi:hypothetical protein
MVRTRKLTRQEALDVSADAVDMFEPIQGSTLADIEWWVKQDPWDEDTAILLAFDTRRWREWRWCTEDGCWNEVVPGPNATVY